MIATVKSNTSDDRFRNILAFVILMAGDRVMTVSPDYLMEKYDRYVGSEADQDDDWKFGLDENNTRIMAKYLKTWFGEEL